MTGARSWIVVVLAACHPNGPASPSTTPAGPQACAAVADHLVELMQPRGAEPEAVARIHRAIADRCTNDRWTIDAQQCFSATKAIDQTDHCATLLTVEQRDAFDQSLGDALSR